MGNWSPLGRQNGGPRRRRAEKKSGCFAVVVPDRWLRIDWRGPLTKTWHVGKADRRQAT